jgi:hypothetical protein
MEDSTFTGTDNEDITDDEQNEVPDTVDEETDEEDTT